MSQLRADRRLAQLLTASCLLTAGAATAYWVATRGDGPAYLAWIAAVALVTLAATVRFVVRRSAKRIAMADAEIARQRELVERMHAKISRGATLQGTFVGTIAHEIKTPLSIVLIQADLLFRSTDDPDVRVRARTISEDIRHLADLVDGLLRLARPLRQEDRSHHVPVHIHDVVLECVRRCRGVAHFGGVTVVPTLVEPDHGDTPEVLGDPTLLGAMLENLVRNAVRFAPRGTQVDLQVSCEGESVLLHVRDRGKGIAAEHLEAVFNWFFQGPTDVAQYAGTGFGLAIAQRIAEHHRGVISLRNQPEGGCEFAVTLPRWRSDPGASMALVSGHMGDTRR